MTTPTGKLVVFLLAFLLVLEMLALMDSTPGNTISEVIWQAITGRPFIPFLSGFLAGHLFWQAKRS